MAGVALGLHPSLRPFREAGVDFLLLGEQAIGALRAARAGTTCGDVPRTPPRPSADPSVPPRRVPPRPGPTASPAVMPGGVAPERRGPSASALVRPPSDWPGSWTALLARTPRHPAVVWTYPALADDMARRGDGSRGDLFRRLLQALALPAGSNAFWPMREPSSDGPAVDGSFFASGIAALGPRAVVIVCDDVPEELGMPPMPLLLPVVHLGTRCVRFHPVERLARLLGEPRGIGNVVAYVRTLLEP